MNAVWLQRGLKATVAAALLIGASEGLILTAQPDIKTGQPNICHGDTHNVKFGDVATPQECAQRLAVQLHAAEADVVRCYRNIPSDPIKAALIDMDYNVGPGKPGAKDGICWLMNGRKPTMRLRAETGDWRGVCDGMIDWRKDWDKYPGLRTRRYNDRNLCLQGL